jgi:hypothetical protein
MDCLSQQLHSSIAHLTEHKLSRHNFLEEQGTFMLADYIHRVPGLKSLRVWYTCLLQIMALHKIESAYVREIVAK